MMKRVRPTLMSFVIVGLGACGTVSKTNKSVDNLCVQNKGAEIMYKKLTPNMMVENVGRTVDFYGDVLGFEFVMGVREDGQEVVTQRQEGGTLAFAVMKCGGVEMMFQTRKSLSQEIPAFGGMGIGGSFTFYIDVEDVDGLYAKLKDKVTMIKDMQTTFYGKREFYIRDCNGYVLVFAGGL